MKEPWLFKEGREHIHWWDSVSPHMLVSISACIPYLRSPVCPVQLVGSHAGSRKREVLYCRWVARVQKNKLDMQSMAFNRVGKVVFFDKSVL